MRALVSNVVAIAVVIAHVSVHEASAQSIPDVSGLALPGGSIQTEATPRIFGLRGDFQVVVQLINPPLAVAQGKNAKRVGGKMGAGQQRDYLDQLRQKQDALVAVVGNLGGREIGRLGKALNAVIVAIDVSQVAAIAALPGVRYGAAASRLPPGLI